MSVRDTSGVTTDPADPAMQGDRGPIGAQNYGINFLNKYTWSFMFNKMWSVNVTKYAWQKSLQNLLPSDLFFQAPNAAKPVFGRGSALDPAGGAYNAPQTS